MALVGALAVCAALLLARNGGRTDLSRYAGSARCASCHPAEHAAWQGSHHARAQVAASAPEIAGAFALAPGAREQGRPAVRAEGADGRSQAHRVEAAIGVSPLVQFLVAFDRGRLQPTALAWDPRRAEWFDLHAGEGRRPGEWGHWTGRGMTWNLQCATCHVTGYRKNYDADRDTYGGSWVEAGVGCEACHGPRLLHAVEAARGRRSPRHGPAGSSGMEACMPCHSRRRQVDDAFVPGAAGERRQLLGVYEPVLPDDAAYHPDGQIKEEDYEWVSFQQSRMHARDVACRDCHDPHSGRPRARVDGLCLRCHEWRLSTPAHTHYRPDSPGARASSATCRRPRTCCGTRAATTPWPYRVRG